MPPSDAKSKATLGFLTVIEDPQHGLFGGYLVLNPAGRPLEFHCTAPIKPNRAQEILYGATLQPYLFGEQIGRSLVTQAKAPPEVICTDREPALAVREYVGVPVVLVLPAEEGASSAESDTARDTPSSGDAQGNIRRLDAAHAGNRRLTVFQLGRNRLAVPAEAAGEDHRRITEQLDGLADTFDLGEPFHRIREAIEEARRGGQ